MNKMKMSEEKLKEVNTLIDLLDYAVGDISYFSVYNDDIFDAQIGRLEDLVRELRQQLR